MAASIGEYQDMSKSLINTIERWRKHPEIFDREAFLWEEGEGPTAQQVQLFTWVGKLANAKFKVNTGRKCTDEEKALARKLGISIKSGHGTGKTGSLARIYYWLLLCFPESLGYVTAPNAPQLESVLWKEFRKWKRKSPLLDKLFEVQSDKVYHKENKGECFVQARTSNIRATEDEQAETLAGQHADYMIMAADEASALAAGIFKPLEGALTGIMNFIIMITNPTRSQGYFFDSQHRDADRWICLTWNSEESPLVSTDLLEADRHRYGRDSNWYRIRRLGEFPISDGDTLIPYEWVESAINREIEVPDNAPMVKGIDAGAGGDETCLLTRKGNKIFPILTKNEPDTERLKAWIMGELQEEMDDFIVNIDPIGVGNHLSYWLMPYVGSEILPHLKGVNAVDVRRESSDTTCFRLRDELIMKVRKLFESRMVSIPDDEELLLECTTIRSDDPDTTKGKIKIESKKKLRLRGLNSPNKLDALALTLEFEDRYYETVICKYKEKKKNTKPLNWRVL